MKIAIMQPYFMPYGGYFRLMAAADLFVAYDCVQFPRRGWVHRNKLTHRNGDAQWLTLPLAKGNRDTTRIVDLRFMDGAQGAWEERLSEFPALSGDAPLMRQVRKLSGTPAEYIIDGLKTVCDLLGIQCGITLSSALNIPENVRGQDRILAIASHFGATQYVNAPGGRGLYQEDAFAARSIELSFLPDYRGSFKSILERLLTEPVETMAEEIKANV